MKATTRSARTLASPFSEIVKLAAIAALFTLGVSTLRAQTTASVVRRDLADPVDPYSAAVYFRALPQYRTADSMAGMTVVGRAAAAKRASDKAARRKQATSEWNRSVDYSGPRFGFTYLPAAVVDSLKNHNIDVGSTISQFGWQLEHEIHVSAEGPMVLNEWVFLAGGLEKGVFLPSATWLVGARTRSGSEIGFGPNVSLAGVGLALAAGVTMHSGGLHFPMNVAAASSRGGIRVSFLTGFTLH
ncbi:MAG TPA: hypothetical protein VFO55_10790 [Gemmatimonadaceae bacterium]|nr:hypothetical protein [Gemmatimonadaceae bacterium]